MTFCTSEASSVSYHLAGHVSLQPPLLKSFHKKPGIPESCHSWHMIIKFNNYIYCQFEIHLYIICIRVEVGRKSFETYSGYNSVMQISYMTRELAV